MGFEVLDWYAVGKIPEGRGNGRREQGLVGARKCTYDYFRDKSETSE